MTAQSFVGHNRISTARKSIEGTSMAIDGEEFYLIRNVDQMNPFFMTIVSSSDHWMFISSNGGLSAGRTNAEKALFPYYSDDKITDSAERVGSKTIVRVARGEKIYVWEPFMTYTTYAYSISRNLYKNGFGSKVIFEETNHDLSLTFRYSWQYSERFGFVKKSELINHSDSESKIEILDGLQNILPFGVGTFIQNFSSNLVNGYKRNLLDENSGIGVFTLSAMIVDRAEPSEALKATTVWSSGLEVRNHLLSIKQTQNFKLGEVISSERDVKGMEGAYLVHSDLSLKPAGSRAWYIVAEVAQDRAQFEDLKTKVTTVEIIDELIEDIRITARRLEELVGKADGLQLSNDKRATGRHINNVMFNIMRGGIFEDDYQIEVDDFLVYLKGINNQVFGEFSGQYKKGEFLKYDELIQKAEQTGNPDLIRISHEYLPLTFSRRHGDPSRPWNKFNIDLKNPDGSKKRSYEGNWRDIFQNWEALAYAYPEYISGMIFKFLNATTIDGYNPYRITRNGIDWEIIEPDDPWSYIGYWGDHQIIYLQKLLECAFRHHPESIQDWFTKEIFVFANVPYDIKDYNSIVSNPQDTVDFNQQKQHMIENLVSEQGADGKFVQKNGKLVKATFTEKMLVTLLAKMYNFIPEGGIWLNTQRPEWNDANNALVGNGISMVTVYYLRRFCQFLKNQLENTSVETHSLHDEVYDLFLSIRQVLESFSQNLNEGYTDKQRKEFVDRMGRAGEDYRNQAYAGFKGTRKLLISKELVSFLDQCLSHIDHAIRANKREDSLYHAYNLLEFEGDELHIDYLYEMLEGQVSVLSSDLLSGSESLEVLDALKASKMFREDQYSYFLYPNREIPHFLNKNQIPEEFVNKSMLLAKLKKDGNRHLVTFDEAGRAYFNGDIRNAADVKSRLEDLTSDEELVLSERDSVLKTFEEMFDHKSFTGRSGTFFAFEGLGSIYWHMVSKLLYATQEVILRCKDQLTDSEKGRLIQHYYEIRAGIGINKQPDLYGAFPTDPYSHTPLHKGAQQPGMTGQVKEDVLNRWAELGVVVENGQVNFSPVFLNSQEFLSVDNTYEYFDLSGEWKTLTLGQNQLAFTYCQVPVIYERSNDEKIDIVDSGKTYQRAGSALTIEESKSLFKREGKISQIKVFLKR